MSELMSELIIELTHGARAEAACAFVARELNVAA